MIVTARTPAGSAAMLAFTAISPLPPAVPMMPTACQLPEAYAGEDGDADDNDDTDDEADEAAHQDRSWDADTVAADDIAANSRGGRLLIPSAAAHQKRRYQTWSRTTIKKNNE